jgi:uncharacterized protein (TIGR00369 family)
MIYEKASKILARVHKTPSKFFDSALFKSTELVRNNSLVFGVRVKDEFCNMHGTLHGGAISTLVDCTTTIHAWAFDPHNRVCISSDLSVSFYVAVNSGQYLEIVTSLSGVTDRLAFATASLFVGNKPVGKGSHALFYLEEKLPI